MQKLFSGLALQTCLGDASLCVVLFVFNCSTIEGLGAANANKHNESTKHCDRTLGFARIVHDLKENPWWHLISWIRQVPCRM